MSRIPKPPDRASTVSGRGWHFWQVLDVVADVVLIRSCAQPGLVTNSKSLQGSRTRELLGGTEENSVSQMRGH